jgi:hypothetical protein
MGGVRRRRGVLNLFVAFVLGLSVVLAEVAHFRPVTPAGPLLRPVAQTTYHYISNSDSSTSTLTALGFNLFDVTASASDPQSTKSTVDALPTGGRAVVWVGNYDNSSCTPAYSDAQLTANVGALAGDPKVFAWYIADEPHPRTCPSAAADMAARTLLVHQADGSAKTFIVVADGSSACRGTGLTYGCEYRALAGTADFIGVDVYPCHYSGTTKVCDFDTMSVRLAAAARYLAPGAVVPTFQVFGQECNAGSHYYALPSVADLGSIYQKYAAYWPNPPFDYTYTWGHQNSANPTLLDATGGHSLTCSWAGRTVTFTPPNLQAAVKTHNGL